MEAVELRTDPGSRALRASALLAGTMGLLAVGLLAVMITPARNHAGMSTSATSTSIVPLTTAFFERASAELAGALGVARRSEPAGSTTPAAPLATLLESGVALVTAKSLDGYPEGAAVSVRTASGDVVAAEVMRKLGGTAMVELDAATPGVPTHPVAAAAPPVDALVTLLLDVPRELRLDELATTEVPEGTPVIDADGHLIGLCTLTADGTTLIAAPPAPEPAAPTSTLG